ncbi:MAG: hypothetical protein LBJ42_01630 [Holosporales bacterium]|jgi:hypothetical protein|nr:hypothetical protein [Holosporales bacterium]
MNEKLVRLMVAACCCIMTMDGCCMAAEEPGRHDFPELVGMSRRVTDDTLVIVGGKQVIEVEGQARLRDEKEAEDARLRVGQLSDSNYKVSEPRDKRNVDTYCLDDDLTRFGARVRNRNGSLEGKIPLILLGAPQAIAISAEYQLRDDAQRLAVADAEMFTVITSRTAYVVATPTGAALEIVIDKTTTSGENVFRTIEIEYKGETDGSSVRPTMARAIDEVGNAARLLELPNELAEPKLLRALRADGHQSASLYGAGSVDSIPASDG